MKLKNKHAMNNDEQLNKRMALWSKVMARLDRVEDKALTTFGEDELEHRLWDYKSKVADWVCDQVYPDDVQARNLPVLDPAGIAPDGETMNNEKRKAKIENEYRNRHGD